ncbi:hypothetical protein BX600DRAFT_148523 [Xylariales sp. PMI_506]|nr:hypothetical protein BX600DRAFT_148523 [Xylariales sp. PMI_506]
MPTRILVQHHAHTWLIIKYSAVRVHTGPLVSTRKFPHILAHSRRILLRTRAVWDGIARPSLGLVAKPMLGYLRLPPLCPSQLPNQHMYGEHALDYVRRGDSTLHQTPSTPRSALLSVNKCVTGERGSRMGPSSTPFEVTVRDVLCVLTSGNRCRIRPLFFSATSPVDG